MPETGLVEYPEHQNLMYLLDGDGKKQTIASVPQWETRRSHILRNMQVVMGPLPSKDRIVPREMRVIETVDDPAFTRKKIEYRTEASTTVRAWLFTPKRLRGKVAAVLCLHQTIGIGKDEPAGLGAIRTCTTHCIWHSAAL